MIQDDTLIQIAGDGEIVSCLVAGEVVLFDARNGLHYGLDEVGASVWNLLQKSRPLKELRRSLLERYDVEPGRCGHDLIALLYELSEAGLIEIDDAQASL